MGYGISENHHVGFTSIISKPGSSMLNSSSYGLNSSNLFFETGY